MPGVADFLNNFGMSFHIADIFTRVKYYLFIYLFIYLRTQHSKQYKIEDTIKAAKF